jgi:hypothetical protein
MTMQPWRRSGRAAAPMMWISGAPVFLNRHADYAKLLSIQAMLANTRRARRQPPSLAGALAGRRGFAPRLQVQDSEFMRISVVDATKHCGRFSRNIWGTAGPPKAGKLLLALRAFRSSARHTGKIHLREKMRAATFQKGRGMAGGAFGESRVHARDVQKFSSNIRFLHEITQPPRAGLFQGTLQEHLPPFTRKSSICNYCAKVAPAGRRSWRAWPRAGRRA